MSVSPDAQPVQTAAARPSAPFTDSGEQHPNLILGNLQALAWLLFHPSAWRSYVARIDPALEPNVPLMQLRQAHWRSPALRRLLFGALLVNPPLFGTIAALMTLAIGAGGDAAAMAFWGGTLKGLLVGLVALSLAGLATGSILIPAVGLFTGLMYGVAYGWGFNIWFVVVTGIINGMLNGLLVIAETSIVGTGRRAASTRPVFGMLIGAAIGLLLTGVFAVGLRGAAVGLLNIVPFMALFGVVFGAAFGWQRGLLAGMLIGATTSLFDNLHVAIAQAIPGYLVFGVGYSTTVVALAPLVYVIGRAMAGPWAGGIATAVGLFGAWLAITGATLDLPLWSVVPLAFACPALGVLLATQRSALYYPAEMIWNTLLLAAERRRRPDQTPLLRCHAAFWDELQDIPLAGFDEHLLLVFERNAEEARAGLRYLGSSRQRWAAQAVQIELDARLLERCADVQTIARAHYDLAVGELRGPASALLRSFSHHSRDVEVALNQTSAYHQRLALSVVEDKLNGLTRELTRSNERYAARFYPIATRWCEIAGAYVRDLAQAVERSQEIDNPYVFGVPLTQQEEIFVGRTDVALRIEQLLLDARRPPVLLYGQRRMGKTSLLRNLSRLLPSTIIPLFVDGEGIAGVGSYAAFLARMARQIERSAQQHRGLVLPPIGRDAFEAEPFDTFVNWLDAVEQAVRRREAAMALLAIDEIEALDSVIDKGRFDAIDVLRLFRHLVQHHPSFKVLLAGSHTPDELQRWAGYLINMQTVKLSYLAAEEARQLVEQPVKEFGLHFEPDASQRVRELTRGHPHLTQLLCYEIVALKNEQPPERRRAAMCVDVEDAVPRALSSGSLFFTDIEHNQIDENGRVFLQRLAERGEGAIARADQLGLAPSAELDQSVRVLLLRDLIEPAGDGYRFQVELIRRWFCLHIRFSSAAPA